MVWFEGFERHTLRLQGLPVAFRRSADWHSGLPVLALCKDTAVAVSAPDGAPVDLRANRLQG